MPYYWLVVLNAHDISDSTTTFPSLIYSHLILFADGKKTYTARRERPFTTVMATAATEKPVNGNYGAHPNYQTPESYQPAQSIDTQASTQSSDQNNSASSQSPSSAEIGWYFVEQYYNTMSKEPGKLFVSHFE